MMTFLITALLDIACIRVHLETLAPGYLDAWNWDPSIEADLGG